MYAPPPEETHTRSSANIHKTYISIPGGASLESLDYLLMFLFQISHCYCISNPSSHNLLTKQRSAGTMCTSEWLRLKVTNCDVNSVLASGVSRDWELALLLLFLLFFLVCSFVFHSRRATLGFYRRRKHLGEGRLVKEKGLVAFMEATGRSRRCPRWFNQPFVH